MRKTRKVRVIFEITSWQSKKQLKEAIEVNILNLRGLPVVRKIKVSVK